MLLSFALVLGLVAQQARAELVINEFLANPGQDWDGDGVIDSKLDEWIEVFNPGPDPVDLTDYWLRDALDDNPNLNLFGTLDSGETAVFFGFHAVAWQAEHGAGSAGLSLNNGGDTVVLMKTDQDDPSNLIIIDSFQYPAHVGAVDRSCGRSSDGGQWQLFDGLNPYGGSLFPVGNGCEPSPGSANECGNGTANMEASWSAVKAIWK
jgi:hypothetical protein